MMIVLQTTDLPLLSMWTGLLSPEWQQSLYVYVYVVSYRIINLLKYKKKVLIKNYFLTVMIFIKKIIVYFIQKSSKLSIC